MPNPGDNVENNNAQPNANSNGAQSNANPNGAQPNANLNGAQPNANPNGAQPNANPSNAQNNILNDDPDDGLNSAMNEDPQDAGAPNGRLQASLERISQLEKQADLKGEAETFLALRKALAQLNRLTDKQFTRKSDMYPVMTDENFKELKTAYEHCGILCDKYLHSKVADDPDLKELTDLVKNCANVLRSDLNALQLYDRLKPVTFALLLDYARTDLVETDKDPVDYIDLGDKDLGTVGANMSRRIPFNYVMPDGSEVKGVFTPEKYLDPEKMVLGKIDDICEEYGGVKDYFVAAYEGYKIKNAKNIGKPGYLVEREFTQEFYNIEVAIADLSQRQQIKEVAEFIIECIQYADPKLADKYAKEIRQQSNGDNAAEASLLFSQSMGLLKGTGIGLNMDGAGLGVGDRLDSRNTGMSIVADMMGVPNVIAKSRPMKIRYKGQEINGTFMELGKGMDLNKPTLASKYYDHERDYSNRHVNIFENNNLKSASDLAVLDFICGNVDRHGANILYQFDTSHNDYDKHVFLGVQGIDNDASFGTYVPRNVKTARVRMSAINDIRVMGYSTAKAVMEMDPSVLKFRLRGLGITDKEIDAAVRRLDMIKEAIRDGGDMAPEKQAALKKMGLERKGELLYNPLPGKIRVIPDDKFCLIPLDQLSTKNCAKNPYFSLSNFHDEIKKKETDQFDLGGLNPEKVNSAFGFRILPEETGAVQSALDRLASVTDKKAERDGTTHFVRTSEKFEALRSEIDLYKKFCKDHENQLMTLADYDIRNSFLDRILKDADEYLTYKGSGHHLDYASKRIAAVTELRQAFADRLSATDRKLYHNMHYKEEGRTQEEQIYLKAMNKYDDRNVQLFNARIRAEAEKIAKAHEIEIAAHEEKVNASEAAKRQKAEKARRQKAADASGLQKAADASGQQKAGDESGQQKAGDESGQKKAEEQKVPVSPVRESL